jgi:predicted Rossmann fold nucleotide-binding protein DprA/Smf involved in DNA uptake
LNTGGLCIVGSRNVNKDGANFASQAAKLASYSGITVISGGAKGVDQISMDSAIESNGMAVGILADNLLKKSLENKNRKAITEGKLLLVSPYNPNAFFNVGSAMGRNKLIYAMADFALVIRAEYKKGGTWSGAEEELSRENSIPVFVRIGEKMPDGNEKLLELGAIPLYEPIDTDISLWKQLIYGLLKLKNDNNKVKNIDKNSVNLELFIT